VTDDPGVMGNLPRSRPGRRSAKRAAEVKPPKRAGAKKTGAKPSTAAASKSGAGRAKAGSAKARPKTTARPRPKTTATPRPKTTAGARERAPRTAVTDERVEERQGQDPITAALRAGMALGDAGVKVLSKIVQRLPRP
jgi:hypothetical protein